MTLTTETLASIRQRAEQDQVLFNPKDILALIERVRELEAAVKGAREQAAGVVATLCVDDAAGCAAEAAEQAK